MRHIFETLSLIVRCFFVCLFFIIFCLFFVCLVFFLNLIKFCKIIKPQKFKIKFDFVLHLTKKKTFEVCGQKMYPMHVFFGDFTFAHSNNPFKYSNIQTFKYLNVVLFQRVYKYITIRAIKFLWKLGLERWVWILEFSFFIEWKKRYSK